MITYIVGTGSSNPTVWIANINGTGAGELGPGSSALISPDGSEVAAITRSGSSWQLVLYSVRRPARRSSSSRASSSWSCRRSPGPSDAQHLLVKVGASSPAQLWVFDVVARTSTRVATGVFDGASFAPGDTAQIVYADATHSPASLYVTTPTGSSRRACSRAMASGPSGAQSGIVYSRTVTHKGAAALQLWTIKPGGDNPHALTNSTYDAGQQGLAPIAVSSNGTPAGQPDRHDAEPGRGLRVRSHPAEAPPARPHRPGTRERQHDRRRDLRPRRPRSC